MLKYSRLFLILSIIGIANSAYGQEPFSGTAFVSSGYSIPPSSVTVAPGQILVVSVAGARKKLAEPQRASVDQSGNYPTQLGGFSVAVLQEADPQIDAKIIAVGQSPCSTLPCIPITNITLQIPRELRSAKATLLISESAGVLVAVPANVTVDNLHVINSCDQTGLFVSLFSNLQQDASCTPAVIGRNALSDSGNPVRQGDVATTFLYGVGATGANPIRLTYDFQENAGGRTSKVDTGDAPLFIGPIGSQGVYQMNFAIPSIPPGTSLRACDGLRVQSNLTVTVSGSASSDVIRLCVQP